MIAIIDYGMGNLRSVQKALEQVGADARITQKAQDIHAATKVVLPGVGAMGPAMERLQSLNLVSVVQEAIRTGKPFLGICLGFQLLFEQGNEGGCVSGLGILGGSVERFAALKIPHMGWNQLRIQNTRCRLLQGVAENSDVYFCHSYFVRPSDREIIATTTHYGIEFASAVAINNIYGVQFHPEKSQTIGLKILRNFSVL